MCVVLAAGLLSWFGAGATSASGDGQSLPARELSAPPDDLVNGRLRLGPSPTIDSDHALFEVRATAAPGRSGLVQQFDHASDGGDSPLSVVVAMNHAGPWHCTLRGPTGGVWYVRGGKAEQGVTDRVGDMAQLLRAHRPVEALRIDVDKAPSGRWTVELDGPESATGAPGIVMASAQGHHELHGTFQSRVSRVGEPRTFVLSADSRVEVTSASVRGPSGLQATRFMTGSAMTVVPAEPGLHVLTVQGRVEAEGGQWASRSLEVVFDVTASTVRFLSGSEASQRSSESHKSPSVQRLTVDANRDRLLVPIQGGAVDDSVILTAEAWVVAGARAEPVAWLANLTGIEDGHLSLVFDRRWLGRALRAGPEVASVVGQPGSRLELRSLRLQSRDRATLIDSTASADAGPAPEALPFDAADEASLTRGRPGGHPVSASASLGALGSATDAPGGSHALMLVHGYCSDGGPFPANQFSGAVAQFFDPNAARSNDEFAQLIWGFGANYKSFGTVCHSQGGLASLHLYTFYWSGLDWANGPRLIQSVGSPYQGTPLAGNLAVLGSIFGVGCGSVYDMSPEGATAWLSTIPTWARANVWYWTTSYKDYPLSYDYCDFVSDLFLSNPDDGVIEKSKGQLPGATNMGHTEGWCHTTDMEDPPQCTDAARNAQMNGQAAR
jgi:hypothetical protein